MLGVVENKILGPADHLLKRVADAAGVGETFLSDTSCDLSGREGEPGAHTVPDPFFGGEGPERTTCTACGGCMMGCRHGAKNTLRSELSLSGRKARSTKCSPRPE